MGVRGIIRRTSTMEKVVMGVVIMNDFEQILYGNPSLALICRRVLLKMIQHPLFPRTWETSVRQVKVAVAERQPDYVVPDNPDDRSMIQLSYDDELYLPPNLRDLVPAFLWLWCPKEAGANTDLSRHKPKYPAIRVKPATRKRVWELEEGETLPPEPEEDDDDAADDDVLAPVDPPAVQAVAQLEAKMDAKFAELGLILAQLVKRSTEASVTRPAAALQPCLAADAGDNSEAH